MVSLIGQTKLSIAETTGKKRKLVLTGRSMPTRPTEFGGVETNVTLTNYDGNPVASSQVHGTREIGNQFGGVWRDKYLTTDGKVFVIGESALTGGIETTIPLVRVEDIVSTCEDLVRSGQLLKVEWAKQTRLGWMSLNPPMWHTRGWCEWSVYFEWVSGIEEADPPMIEATDKISQSIASATDIAKDALGLVISGMRYVFEGIESANDAIRELEDAVKLVEVVASLGIEIAQGALDSAERAMQGLHTAVRMAKNIKHQALALTVEDKSSYMGWASGLGSRRYLPPVTPVRKAGSASKGGLWSGQWKAGFTGRDVADERGAGDKSYLEGNASSSEAGSYPTAWHTPDNSGMVYHSLPQGNAQVSKVAHNLGKYMRDCVDHGELISNLDTMIEKYSYAAELIRQRFFPQAKTVHRVVKGQDLRRISVKYYGTQNRWRDIADANSVENSYVESGTLLTIPR